MRGFNGVSSGVIHCDDLAILSQWLKYITDNIVGLTGLQMKLYNRNFAVGDRIEYMGWVNEGIVSNSLNWQSYRPRFLVLKGTEVLLFETPPVSRIVCFLLVTSIHCHYRLSVECCGTVQGQCGLQGVPDDVQGGQRVRDCGLATELLPVAELES